MRRRDDSLDTLPDRARILNILQLNTDGREVAYWLLQGLQGRFLRGLGFHKLFCGLQ